MHITSPAQTYAHNLSLAHRSLPTLHHEPQLADHAQLQATQRIPFSIELP